VTLAGRADIHSFDTLHAAWEEIFNVELFNKFGNQENKCNATRALQ